MNWKLLIMLLFTLQHLYTLALHIVHARSANNPTPANVADVYDAETYARWKAYNGEKSRLSILRTVVSWVLSMGMLGLNVYATAAGWFPDGVVWQMLAVILTETVVNTVVFVGFEYVSSIVIEGKYGFNRSTTKTFVMDQVRSFIIEIVLGMALMGLLCWLHLSIGDWVVALFTGAVFLLTLVISLFCRSHIDPCFLQSGDEVLTLRIGKPVCDISGSDGADVIYGGEFLDGCFSKRIQRPETIRQDFSGLLAHLSDAKRKQ
jgi:STE24 endopeptidase